MQEPYPHTNRAASKNQVHQEGPAVLKQLAELNSLDMELYRWGAWKVCAEVPPAGIIYLFIYLILHLPS
jgi:hypothetical protein